MLSKQADVGLCARYRVVWSLFLYESGIPIWYTYQTPLRLTLGVVINPQYPSNDMHPISLNRETVLVHIDGGGDANHPIAFKLWKNHILSLTMLTFHATRGFVAVEPFG